jgi:hypothetical protein
MIDIFFIAECYFFRIKQAKQIINKDNFFTNTFIHLFLLANHFKVVSI